jgi:hypothetical protein
MYVSDLIAAEVAAADAYATALAAVSDSGERDDVEAAVTARVAAVYALAARSATVTIASDLPE